MVGRYVRYIGKPCEEVLENEIYLIKSLKDDGLLRIRDNEDECYWEGKDDPDFELMPENWTPSNDSLINSIQIW